MPKLVVGAAVLILLGLVSLDVAAGVVACRACSSAGYGQIGSWAIGLLVASIAVSIQMLVFWPKDRQ